MWPCYVNFDLHDKCTRCRDKLIGEDNCVKDKPCKVCDGFSDIQKEMLATPSYKIRKDKKASLLVSPKEVTVLQPVDNEPTFQSPSGQSAHSSSTAPSSSQPASFVTADQLAAISDKWAEQFAHMEALLSRGNVFSTPVSTVKPVDTQPLISQNPFLAPATRPTGPVEVPIAVDALVKTKTVEQKEKKSHKSRKEKHSETSVKSDQNVVSSDHKSGKKSVYSTSEKKRNRSASPAPRPMTEKHEQASAPPADTSSAPKSAHQSGIAKGDKHKSTSGHDKNTAGSLFRSTSTVSQPDQDSDQTFTGSGACAFPPDTEVDPYEQVSEDEH